MTSVDKTRPGTPAHWIFLPALVISGAVLCASIWFARNPLLIGLMLSAFIPALAGLVCRKLGRRVASSVCAVIVVGWYWIPPFTVLLLIETSSAREEWKLLFLAFTLVYISLCIILLFALSILATFSLAKRLGPAWPFSAFIVGFVCAMTLVVSMRYVSAHYDKAGRLDWARPLDPLVLGPDVLAIDKCAQQFASARPDAGYPGSLDQLGPQGTQCLPPDFNAADKGFTIRYQPGSRDENGRIDTYKVNAMETSPKGADTSSMFSDDSGIIWFRFDGPHGQGSTNLYDSPEYVLHKVLFCVSDGAWGSSWRFVDGQQETLVTDKNEYVRRCLGPDAVRGKDNSKFSVGEFEFEYNFDTQNGTVSGYRLMARPRSYGITGLRSYLAVGTISTPRTLRVFATPQDRSATAEDPLALSREIDMPAVGRLASVDN